MKAKRFPSLQNLAQCLLYRGYDTNQDETHCGEVADPNCFGALGIYGGTGSSPHARYDMEWMDSAAPPEAGDDENEHPGAKKFVRDSMKRTLAQLLILMTLSPVACVTQEARNDEPQASYATMTVAHRPFSKNSARDEELLTEDEIELKAKLNNQLNHYQYVGQNRPRLISNNLSLMASNSEANWLAHSSSEDTIWSRRFRALKSVDFSQMKAVPGYK